MFDYLRYFRNYEYRKVARSSGDGGFLIDTVYVSDGQKPFETAIQHREYNNHKLIVVEGYSTKEAAKIGHEKWLKIMTSPILPIELVDCRNTQIIGYFGEIDLRRHVRNKQGGNIK